MVVRGEASEVDGMGCPMRTTAADGVVGGRSEDKSGV
jgi:hypothetical protein